MVFPLLSWPYHRFSRAVESIKEGWGQSLTLVSFRAWSLSPRPPCQHGPCLQPHCPTATPSRSPHQPAGTRGALPSPPDWIALLRTAGVCLGCAQRKQQLSAGQHRGRTPKWLCASLRRNSRGHSAKARAVKPQRSREVPAGMGTARENKLLWKKEHRRSIPALQQGVSPAASHRLT